MEITLQNKIFPFASESYFLMRSALSAGTEDWTFCSYGATLQTPLAVLFVLMMPRVGLGLAKTELNQLCFA